MMTTSTATRLIIISWFVLSAGAACAAEPWAATVPFEPYQQFDTITVPNGDADVFHDLRFPAIHKKPGTRTVLRFRSRLHNDRPSGWNYFLGINLNGTQVHGFTPNGTPRVINRDAQVTLDEGEPYTWPWWNTIGGAAHVDLLTFFGPGGNVLDERIKSDRDELYWFVIDVDDLVNEYRTGLDDVVIADEENHLRLSNGLHRRYIKGAEMDLIIDDLAIGAIPDDVWKQQTRRFIAKVEPLTEPISLRHDGVEVQIGKDGAMHLIRDGQTFGIDSRFSYPGDKIGYHNLGAEPGWQVKVGKHSDSEAQVTATSALYDVKRRVFFDGDRVRINDTFTNKLGEPLGIDVRHRFTTDEPFATCLLGGVPEIARNELAENPTVFMNAGPAALAALVEDNVTRLHLEALAQPNRVLLHNGHMGLAPGASYTTELTLYPMAGDTDWWAFVNRLRRDWGIDFTIDGPWDFFNVIQQRALIVSRDRLQEYLDRKNLKIVALVPWLDYENYDPDTGGLVARDKYRRLVTEAAAAFRAIDPDIKVTGCMESFPISLPLDEVALLVSRLPNKGQGYPKVRPEMLEGLGSLTERDRDCLFVSRDGYISCEIYYRGKDVPLGSFAAYPAVGNAHHERLMEQARFIKESCGLDGIYIDCFSLAFESNMSHLRYDYRKWDGHTVNIDPATGRITDMYTDAGLVGATSRKALIEYVLQDGGVFVANSYPAVRETQSLHTFRFSESEYNFNPLAQQRGEVPPLFFRMTGGQLSTPIGLGYRTVRLRPNDKGNEARIIMKTVITYLRYGGLFYHYNTELPADAAYGPINHMYPITPVELGEGFCIGKERIVTAVSGTFTWLNDAPPRVIVFDLTGHEVDAPVTIDGNQVTIDIENWERIAVVEPRSAAVGTQP